MSLGSGAERFLFVFNLHPCPYPTPLPVHHPFLLMALETNRLSSDTLQKYLRDPVWDKGRKHYIGLSGSTGPGSSSSE